MGWWFPGARGAYEPDDSSSINAWNVWGNRIPWGWSVSEELKPKLLAIENHVEIADPWSSPVDISVHVCPGCETVIDMKDRALTKFSIPFGRADGYLISYYFHSKCVPSVEELASAFAAKYGLHPAVTQKIMEEFEREL
jgi:hypothetical protein